MAQVDAMLRIKELVGPGRVVKSYQEFDYQAAIYLFDSGTGVDKGLLAKLGHQVSNVTASFVDESEDECA